MKKYRLRNIFGTLLIALSIISLIGCGAGTTTTPDNPPPSVNPQQQQSKLYIAVGDNGAVVVSSDGNQWTAGPTDQTLVIWDIAYGSWVGVGLKSNVDGFIASYSDTSGWSSTFTNAGTIFTAVASDGGNKLVAIGWDVINDGGIIFKSEDDGQTWTKVEVKELAGNPLNDIAYGDGKWVAVGAKGKIFYSIDMNTWTLDPSTVTNDLIAIAYGANNWVAVGIGGTILHTTAQSNWTSATSGISKGLRDVVFGGGKWVAVGEDGTVIHSDNASNWSSVTQSSTPEALNAIIYDDSNWLAVGTKGRIIHTNNGNINDWTSVVNTGTTEDLHAVAFKP